MLHWHTFHPPGLSARTHRTQAHSVLLVVENDLMVLSAIRSSYLGFCGANLLLLGASACWAMDDPEDSTLPPPATRKVDFVKDVQPIFSKRCFECHGPQTQKSGLRLDRKEKALAGGDSGPPFEAGKSEESLLIEYVAGLDPDTVMPPKGDRLTPEEVGLLRAWIDQGADWPASADMAILNHWSFLPIHRPEVPAVQNSTWVRNPIDAFVLSKLESLKVEPSPEADRTTLIRRLSLDLLGLPPTPAEVARFVADTSPSAYERLVDRLLASPHFGERWGRHWLDLARYADSDGYEGDAPRPNAWRYRDWVIDAINRDMPFDSFTIEQLAGDLLPDATLEQKTATGFHRNTLTNKEGGVDPEEFRVAAVVDRVNTTGTVWLGLTVGCAQCHTHKYDPLLHSDYYGLFAFFNTAKEVDVSAPLPGEMEAYNAAQLSFDAEHEKLKAVLKDYDENALSARQAEWERNVTLPSARWTVLNPIRATSSGGATLKVRPDGSILASGTKPDYDTYTVAVSTDLTDITAFRIEVIDDPSLPSRGPGRSRPGNLVLSELSVQAEAEDHHDGGDKQPISLKHATADFSQNDQPVTAAIDGDTKTGWAILGQEGQRHVAVFESEHPTGFPGGTTLTFVLDQQQGLEQTIGRLRISATKAAGPIEANAMPDEVVEILALAPESRSDAQKARLGEYHRTIDPQRIKLQKAVAEHSKKAPPPPSSKVQTLAENSSPPKTHILIRGDFLRKGDEVNPHTPAVLHAFHASDSTPTRLDLARWIVDPANPLTARVSVNRIWQHLFGRGLVTSVDDFGTRGESPSHPELLDWLASEFVARGWSRKTMIKQILMSSTYRQSSSERSDLADRDPNNVWLARQSRVRLEAEILRDVSLAASGLLTPTIGGPSVHPPQPPGISELTYAGKAKWVDSTGPDRYRRGMYTWFQRTSPYPMLMTFDAPDSNVCSVKRERSNTPLQALTLLNDTVFVECAQALGRRIIEESSHIFPEERLRYAFQLCLARDPQEDELIVLGRLYDHVLAQCQPHPEEAAQLAGTAMPPGVDPAEAAAWVAMGRTLLNLDEFVTRE
jgi:mono/diheme cytochrome c family protein